MRDAPWPRGIPRPRVGEPSAVQGASEAPRGYKQGRPRRHTERLAGGETELERDAVEQALEAAEPVPRPKVGAEVLREKVPRVHAQRRRKVGVPSVLVGRRRRAIGWRQREEPRVVLGA